MTDTSEPNDTTHEVDQVHREVGADPGTVLLRRRYDATIEDVWDACTDGERISRWFLPVTGDLRLGGRYQLEGNAGGEIVRCEPPRLLAVTWVFGDNPPSRVEVRLSPGEGTTLELEHSGVGDPDMWAAFGPGAVGVGWDLVVLGLGLHLRTGGGRPPESWQRSPEAREFIGRSSAAWGAAFVASGASAAEAAAAVEHTTAFYAPASAEPNA